MKKYIFIAMLSALPFVAMAQHEEDTENGVVSLAGREGFTIETKKGDFVFKPYLLVQTSGNFNWYDEEGLDKAYNQDNVANSGFSIPYAVLGFTGKAFGKVSFHECRSQWRSLVTASVVRRTTETTICDPCRQVQDPVLTRLSDDIG